MKTQVLNNVYVWLKSNSKFENCLFRIKNNRIIPVENNYGLIVKLDRNSKNKLEKGIPYRISGKLKFNEYSTSAFFEIHACEELKETDKEFLKRVNDALQGISDESVSSMDFMPFGIGEDLSQTWTAYSLVKKFNGSIKNHDSLDEKNLLEKFHRLMDFANEQDVVELN